MSLTEFEIGFSLPEWQPVTDRHFVKWRRNTFCVSELLLLLHHSPRVAHDLLNINVSVL